MKITIILIFIFTILIIGYSLYGFIYDMTHSCIKSHVEQQIQQPLSVVVGGSKYGGGIAMPLGNGKIINVTICDEYK